MKAEDYKFKILGNRIALVRECESNEKKEIDYRFLTSNEIISIFSTFLVMHCEATKCDTMMVEREGIQAFYASIVNKEVCKKSWLKK